MANLTLAGQIQQRAQEGRLMREFEYMSAVIGACVDDLKLNSAALAFFANLPIKEAPKNLARNVFAQLGSTSDDGIRHRAVYVLIAVD